MNEDLIYRAAFMLAVFALIGSFSSRIFLSDEGGEKVELEDLASAMRGVITTAMNSGSGSTVIMDLGTGGDGNGAILHLPGEIAGERLSVKVLPGVILLESGGEMELVIESDAVVPSFAPIELQPIDGTLLDLLPDEGFIIGGPCALEATVVRSSSRTFAFIHPHYQDGSGTIGSGLEDLIGFLGCAPSSMEELEGEKSFEVPGIGILEPPLLFLEASGPEIVSGSCFLPVVLPGNVECPVDGPVELSEGDTIVAKRELEEARDGNIIIRTTVLLR